jgi:ketosteroid isomerase-like protein
MRFACALLLTLLAARPTLGQGQPVKAADPTEAITRLREELIDSFNKRDLDRLISHLSSDVVITWQDGTACHTPAEVRAYYNKMMSGPSPIVKTVSAAPVVDGREVHDNWAVSWGHMNDHFELNSGEKLDFDSRFTATISRDGDVWKVSSFHLSTNTFANPVLKLAVSRTAMWAGGGGVVGGLIVGLLVGVAVGRKRKAGV